MSPFSRCREPTSRMAATYFSSYCVRAGSGSSASLPIGHERQAELVASLEQQGVEHGPVLAGRVEVLDQAVDRGGRAARAERFVELIEGRIVGVAINRSGRRRRGWIGHGGSCSSSGRPVRRRWSLP